MRYLPYLSGLLAVSAFSVVAYSQSSHQPSVSVEPNQVANYASHSLFDRIFNSQDRPDWLTRTYISYGVEKRYTPVGEILTTQPLFMDDLNTVFVQGRLAYISGDGTANLGFGYRYLTSDRQLMWGINTFFDEAIHYNHQRVGLGGEIFTPMLTFRANYYDAISRTRNVGSGTTGLTSYERALTGYDASVEAPFPYISWVKVVAEGYRWRGNKSAGMNGGQVNLRIFPATQVEIDTGVSVDNANGTLSFLKLDYYFGSPAFIENSATTLNRTSGTFATQDLEKQRLQKVVRHDNIVVEKTNNAISGGGVTVTRGT